MIKKRDFYHQNIKYSFNWNLKNHKKKIKELNSNREEFKRLSLYFKQVYEGKLVPNNIFNSSGFPRVSGFKIKGLKRGFLSSFSKKLIRSGMIEEFRLESRLSKLAKNVYESFNRNQIKGKPGHDPVLKNILIKDENSLAIEVPIWKKLDDTYLTGHIDLVQMEDNILKVIDYKPEGRFMHSLPQVAMYGLLMRSKFKIKELKFLTFNKRMAWEYDPVILLTEVRDFLITQGMDSRKWESFVNG